MPLSNERPQVWWKKIFFYVLHLLAFCVLMAVLLWLMSMLLQALPIAALGPFWRDMFIPWAVMLGCALLSVYVLDRLRIGARLSALGFVRSRMGWASGLGALVGSGLVLACFLILWIGGWVRVVEVDFQLGLFLSWLLFFLVQPLAEEVVMRTFLQSQTHFYFGPQAGLIITALVFGLLHADNENFSWIAGLEITAGGYLMGLLYLHTQSIWGPYLLHASWNFMQSTVLGFAVSGVDTYRALELDIAGPEWLTGGDFGIEGSMLSLLLLLGAIAWFWPARKAGLPLADVS
ncbi:MAG: CPBP family intramembrane metalloprotease [Bacteroidetes bacterium]|nr:MAG: CPBP family intramembrane metalloprotease [Bacteroidota bacterium]